MQLSKLNQLQNCYLNWVQNRNVKFIESHLEKLHHLLGSGGNQFNSIYFQGEMYVNRLLCMVYRLMKELIAVYKLSLIHI